LTQEVRKTTMYISIQRLVHCYPNINYIQVSNYVFKKLQDKHVLVFRA